MDEGNNPKLEWMYKTGQDAINREEYLTGRKVDKQFEEAEKLNCVEHEVLPASIGRNYRDIGNKNEQVDMVRKQMEDPLILIRQKEMEARRKILENPVKLKKLQELLKADKNLSSKESKKKSSKKKHKRSKSSSSSSSSSSDSEDLDTLLLEKYKKIKGKSSKNDSDEDSNFIEKKFNVLKNELDKLVKSKKEKSRRRSSSDDDRRHRRDSPVRKRERSRSPQRYKRSRTPDRYRKDYSRNRDNRRRRSPTPKRRDKSPRRRSRSPQKRKDKHRQSRERTKSSERHEKETKFRNKTPPKRSRTKSPKRESPPVANKRHFDDSDDERRYNKPRNFGLITASGEKIAIKNKEEIKRYTKEELKISKPVAKKPEVKKKAPLTEAEIEAKRREMMVNAEWREKDREKTVKKYRESEEKEKLEHEKEFDKEFLNRHLKLAHEQTSSVESRIKSKLNSIQRTSKNMESNFARR